MVTFKFKRLLARACVVYLIFFSLPEFCTGHSHDHAHLHEHDDLERPHYKYSREANIKEQVKPSPTIGSSLWIEALSSTFLVSIAPFFILFLVPVSNNKEHESLLKILLSFASGGLLGDAFLHLIPHAIMPHSHDHGNAHHHHHHHHHHENEDHSHSKVGLWVLTGILLFLIVEKFVRIVKGDHSHSHVTESDVKPKESSCADEKECFERCEDCPENDIEVEPKLKKSVKTEKEKLVEKPVTEDIKVSGYLNLVADFTHNFTDGLAIGASYLAGSKIGLVTTITILFHEIPHEIGDFAVLIQSGCTKKKAMLLQLITAVGAVSGTLVSLISGGIDDEATLWVLPLTAGGFIYIATVSIIPDLLTDTKFVQSIKEIAALLVGVGMMVLVAQYE